jgi:hypothetical protein
MISGTTVRRVLTIAAALLIPATGAWSASLTGSIIPPILVFSGSLWYCLMIYLNTLTFQYTAEYPYTGEWAMAALVIAVAVLTGSAREPLALGAMCLAGGAGYYILHGLLNQNIRYPLFNGLMITTAVAGIALFVNHRGAMETRTIIALVTGISRETMWWLPIHLAGAAALAVCGVVTAALLPWLKGASFGPTRRRAAGMPTTLLSPMLFLLRGGALVNTVLLLGCAGGIGISLFRRFQPSARSTAVVLIILYYQGLLAASHYIGPLGAVGISCALSYLSMALTGASVSRRSRKTI